jgi:hypothetical protein
MAPSKRDIDVINELHRESMISLGLVSRHWAIRLWLSCAAPRNTLQLALRGGVLLEEETRYIDSAFRAWAVAFEMRCA